MTKNHLTKSNLGKPSVNEACSFLSSGSHVSATDYKLIPLTQDKFAIVNAGKYEWLNQWKWYANKKGNTYYALRKDNCKTIKMHRLILGAKQGEITDHINRNGLDNRIKNIHICTKSQNQQNSPKKGNCTSKYKGVSKSKGHKKWRAKTRNINLGSFESEVVAALAYDRKARELYGKSAYTNF